MAKSTDYKLPVVDPATIEKHTGTFYPDEMKGQSEDRIKQRIGDACGITHYGVNKTTLPPGASSALRHWHQNEDEFIYVLEGELTVVSDAGEQVLTPAWRPASPPASPTRIAI